MTKTRLSPLLVLLWLLAIDGIILSATQHQFPPTIATHFDLQGNANGWLETKTHALVFVMLSFGLPLLMVGIFSLAQYLPNSLINLPNRDYWLAPERRTETFAVLRWQSLWLACLALLFVMGLYLLTLEANFHNPARLFTAATWVWLVAFLLAVAKWVTLLYRHFRKTE